MRALRHLPMSVLGLVLVIATLAVVAPPQTSAAPTPAAVVSIYPPGVTGGTFDLDRRLYNPDLASCEEERPANQFVTYPSYAQSATQICAMWGLQNAAAAAYNAMHGYDEGDEVMVSSLYAQAGLVQTFLQQIAYAVGKNVSGVTPAQRAAYQWFLAIQQHFQRTAAAEAQREYQKWRTQQCGYRPPNTTVFAYNPSSQPVCNPDGNPGMIGLFTSVAPPTYANFVQYGRYDAEKILGLAHQAEERIDRTLIDNGIVAGSGAVAAVLAGGAPHVAATLESTAGALGSFLRVVQPHNRAVYNSLRQAGQVVSKAVQGAVKAGRVVLGSQRVLNQMRAAADLVKTGARSLSGPMTIATIAITIAVTRGISVFTAAAIPKQLADDAAAAEPANTDRYVLDLLTADQGVDAPIVYANYRAQLQFPAHTVGVQAAPSACPACVVYDEIPLSAANPPARIRMTALHPDGTPSGWSRLDSVATRINTWGMGASNGALGVPTVSVGIAGGKVWTKQDPSSAPTDETEAGLSGWLPSGELRYFDPSGQPMIAYLNGEQFLTQTSPGSVSAGGYDAGNDCATPGQCTTSTSIVVMGSGGTPELRNEITNGTFFGMECTANTPGTHDCLTDTLSPNGRLVPANGTRIRTSDGEVLEQKGTSQLYRLTIVPNRGTAPAVWVTNRHNSVATNKTNGLPPGGGLVAGETVSFVASEISDAGYDTTYTWHVQTVCPADPDHPAQTIQGVLVCSDDPSYGKRQLPANQQSLTSCEATVGVCTPDAVLGVTWTPDPAFHGGPVATMTGRSVEWTWPAPGTYHLRLVTTDEYGVTRSSDRDLVISAATAPRSVLSFAAAADPQPGSLGPSVIGPVANDTALTVTGCVVSPAAIGTTPYATPAVTIDWGDGGAADDVTVLRGAGGGCTTPWRWEATHTFAVDTHGRPLVQVPITVTTRDVTFPATEPEDLPPGTRASSSATVFANVHAAQLPPTFLGGASATYDFVAAERNLVVGSVASIPDARISYAPASGVTAGGVSCTPGLPSGTGFATLGGNRFQISGIPRASSGGCYAVTITAEIPHGSVEQHAVIVVAQPPDITSAASIAWDPATSDHSWTVTTSGFPAPGMRVTGVDCTTGCGTALPRAVTFHDNEDGTATLSTTGLSADDTGVYEVTIEAASSSGSVTQVLTLTVDGPPVFTSPATTGFKTGQAGSFAIGVSSVVPVTLTCHVDGSNEQCRTGNGAYPFISHDFPSGRGLSLVGSTIAGIPATAGRYPVTLTATSDAGTTTQELTIYVSASGGATITMVDTGNDDNLVSYVPGEIPAGEATFILGTHGVVTLCSNVPGDELRTETVVEGRPVPTPLPAGLSIEPVANTRCGAGDQQLELSGTPTAPVPGASGATAYRLVDDANGLALLTLRLLSGTAPAFSSPDTAQFRAGQPGSFTVSLGTAHFIDRRYGLGCITGATGLPAGLSLTGGENGTATIGGTPLAGGQSKATVTGTDCQGQSTTQQLTIDVAEAPIITSDDTAGFRAGVGGTFEVTTNATAHPKPALSVAGLPDGATFLDHGNGTGTITVSPQMPATETEVALSITASSSAGTDSQQLRLAVGSAPVMISPASGATVVLPRDLTASYVVRSSAVPVAELTASTLPAGLVFTDNGDGTGTLAGAPTALGETEVTVTARNGVSPAATSALHVVVTDPASLAGTTSGAPCATSSGVEDYVFVAATESSWVLCGAGTPAPALTLQSVECDGDVTNLPPGLTFTDRGDGSAVIEGAAAIGSGAACPDGYSVAVAFANAGGTVVEELSFSVQEAIELASPTTTAPFVPGAPNTAAIGAAAVPLPSFAVESADPLPAWLELVDQGTGTAIVTGTPPTSAAGSSVTFSLRVTNGQAAPLVEQITVPVSDIGLGAAAPPAARLGTAYSHRLEVPDGVTVSLAEGGALPQGLTLSPAGVLAGTPTELGRFPVPLALTRGGTTLTTGAIELHVVAGKGALTISQFRTLDPSDWFVQVVNTTEGPIDLAGWHVGLQPPGEEESIEVPLGTGSLDPGETAVVTTPLSSLGSQLGVSGTSAGQVALQSGFRVVAPSGVVTDAAGVVGALSDLVEGDGVSYPTRLTKAHLRYAFVRTGFADGALQDSEDNATDFTFAKVVGVEDPPADPPLDPPAPGTTSVSVGLDVAAPVFGQPVTATASVTAPGQAAAGTVQFAVDGVDVGGPVTVSGGSAQSQTLGARPVGAHAVTAEYRPSGSGATVVGRATFTVGRAATTTEVAVGPSAFTATVTAVAPGAGRPTGAVTFLLDGAEIGSAPLQDGVATLEHDVPTGASPTVAASYAGDGSFTGSSASTARRDPAISARISSAEPRSTSGWYRTAVTVSFTCTPAGAPLVGDCPAPVTLRREGAGQAITRTVTAADGGMATVVVSPINIDRTVPEVRVRSVRAASTGRPPRGVCAAQDVLSGVASCTITRSIRPRRVVYVAVATDEAGNTATDRVVVRRRR
ncbi:Ig-like domain-containing protein [Nocardioides sp.]|uniref:Ig-like domain-containing protein n=1 Tax=Nocardioides sp. TaxID=35761 RepID=UPI0025CE62A7|nr:Ig-like domain-containing protein [Nocardioides sp.]